MTRTVFQYCAFIYYPLYRCRKTPISGMLTLTTGVEATVAPLAEELFGLEGDADGAGLSLFPLEADAAECEKVNLKLPVCVRFGRFSLSSLSLTIARREMMHVTYIPPF